MGPSVESSREQSKQTKLQTSTAITVTANDPPKLQTKVIPEESEGLSTTEIVMQKAAKAAQELTRKRAMQKLASQVLNTQIPTTQIVLQQPPASQYVQSLPQGMQVLQTLPSGVQYFQAMQSGNQLLETLPLGAHAMQTGNQAIQYQIVSTADPQPAEGEVKYQVVSSAQPKVSSGAVQNIVNSNPSVSDEAVQYQVVSANSCVPSQGVQYQVVSADPSLSANAVQYQVLPTDASLTGGAVQYQVLPSDASMAGGAVQYQVVSGGQLMQFVQPQAASVNQIACWPPTQTSDSSPGVQYITAGVNGTNLQTVMLDQGAVGDPGMQMMMIQMPQEEKWCEICQTNYEPLTRFEHEKRVSHYKNTLKIKGDAWTRFCPPESVYCPICNCFVKISSGLQEHEKSAKHKHNAELQFLPASPVEFLQGYCEVCRVKVLYDPDQNMMKKHYSSELHSANMGLIGGENLWVDEQEDEELWDEEIERQETLAYKKWKKRQKKAMQGLHIKKPVKKRAGLTERQLKALERNSSSGTSSKQRPVRGGFPGKKISGAIMNRATPPVTRGGSMPGSLFGQGRGVIPQTSRSRGREEVNLPHGFGYERSAGYGRGALGRKPMSHGRGMARGHFTGAIDNGQLIGFQHGLSHRQGFPSNLQRPLQVPESRQSILPPASAQHIGLQQGVMPGNVNLVGSHQRFVRESGQLLGPSQQMPLGTRQIIGPSQRSTVSPQEIVGPHQGARAQRIPQSLRLGLTPSFGTDPPVRQRRGLRSLRTGMRPVVCGIQGPAVSEQVPQPAFGPSSTQHINVPQPALRPYSTPPINVPQLALRPSSTQPINVPQQALRPSSTQPINENIEPAQKIQAAIIGMPQLALQPSSTNLIKENVEPAGKLKATIIEKKPRGRLSELVHDKMKRKTDINRRRDEEMLEYFQKVDEVSKTYMKINSQKSAQVPEIGPITRPEGHADRLIPQIRHQPPAKKTALKIATELGKEKTKSAVRAGSSTISFLPPGIWKSRDLGIKLANGKGEFPASEKDVGQLKVGMRKPPKLKEVEPQNRSMTLKSQTAAAKTPTVTSDIKLQSLQQKCTNITAEFGDKPAPSNKLRNPKLRKPESLSIQPGTGKSEKRTTRALKKPRPDGVLVRDKPAPSNNLEWNPTLRRPNYLSIEPGSGKSEKKPKRASKQPTPDGVLVGDKPAQSNNLEWNPTLGKPKSLSIQPGTGWSEKRPTRALKKVIPGCVLVRDKPAPSNKLERNPTLTKPKSLSKQPGTGKSEKRPTRALNKPIPGGVIVRDKPAPSNKIERNPTLSKKSLSIQPGTDKNEKTPTRALKKPIPGGVLASISLPPGLQSSIESSDTKMLDPQKKNQPSVPNDPLAPDCLNSNPSTSVPRSTPESTDIRKLRLRKKSLAVTVTKKPTSHDGLDPHCFSPRHTAATERPGIEHVTKREQRLSVVVKRPLSNTCQDPNPPPPRPKAGLKAIRKVIRLTANAQIPLRTNPPPPRLLRKSADGADNPPPPIRTNKGSISSVGESKTPLRKPHPTVDVKGTGPQFDDEVSDGDISVGNDDEFDFGDSSSEEFSCEEEFTALPSPKLEEIDKRVIILKRALDRDRDSPNSARNVRMKKNKRADEDSLMDKDVQGEEVQVRPRGVWRSKGGRAIREGYGRCAPANEKKKRLGAY